MTDLVVRRLLIDLVAPISARWNGNDAFRSAFFNALSMSFPVEEQYFMDSVRAGLKALPKEKRQAFATEVQGFVGQEATHRRIHALFNGHLEALGFDVYRALGGTEQWRLRLLTYITWTFAMDITRQTIRNLFHDGSLFKWSTWQSASRLLFAKDGMIRSSCASWNAYKEPTFHPRQHDISRSVQWLHDNRERFAVVGQAS